MYGGPGRGTGSACTADGQLKANTATVNTPLTTVNMLNLASKSPHVEVLGSLARVMLSLQQLKTSFCTIIMPKGLKILLHEDATVLEVANAVENIISSGGLALSVLRHELQLHTRCVMLGMESSHQPAVEVAAAMRTRYQLLITTAATDTMTTGQKQGRWSNGDPTVQSVGCHRVTRML